MDLKMKAEEQTTNGPVWDVKIINGIVPLITDDEEDMQNATLAAFLIKGTIPQLPETGVAWTDYLANKITFGELDAQIRQAIINAGQTGYYPKYDITDDKLTMTVGKRSITEAI